MADRCNFFSNDFTLEDVDVDRSTLHGHSLDKYNAKALKEGCRKLKKAGVIPAVHGTKARNTQELIQAKKRLSGRVLLSPKTWDTPLLCHPPDPPEEKSSALLLEETRKNIQVLSIVDENQNNKKQMKSGSKRITGRKKEEEEEEEGNTIMKLRQRCIKLEKEKKIAEEERDEIWKRHNEKECEINMLVHTIEELKSENESLSTRVDELTIQRGEFSKKLSVAKKSAKKMLNKSAEAFDKENAIWDTPPPNYVCTPLYDRDTNGSDELNRYECSPKELQKLFSPRLNQSDEESQWL